MKKVFFTISMLFILSILKTNAQVYSPGYAGYVGNGIIYYPNGYYQGGIYNGYANGTGTYYWSDGSFFYGSFSAGFQNGAGVLMSRYYGYVSGCWYAGSFVGACQNTYNPYNNQNTVQNLVTQVQREKPANTPTNNYQAYDPDGYKVTQIDPNTEMGKTVLGKYK
jgi:hypothetical protein